ncbi:MAG: hypothetical protein J5714_03515 [Alphaproteobacteria bacterium]|nr:hypothetical protein [Alphaproteobacteria bacterium]
MKSFLLVVILAGCFIQNGFAGCNTDHTLTFKGNQKPEHDEFLYLDKYQYDASVEGYKNTRKQNSGSGKAYECDSYHTSGCSVGETVTMPEGHVFQGILVNTEQRYQCVSVPFNDKWVAVGDCKCCNSLQFGNIPVGGAYNRNLSKAECSGYNKTDATHGSLFQLRCQENRNLLCWAIECDDSNMVPDSNGICVAKKKPSDDTCTAVIKGSTVVLNRGEESSIDLTAAECSAAVKVAHGGGSMDPNGLYHFYCGPMCKKVSCQQGYENDENGVCIKKGNKKTCREQRAGMSIEAIACCDTGTDAVWDKPIKGKCNCKDSNAHFEIIGGRGQCVANVTPPPVVIPPVIPVTQPCTDPDNMDSDCRCTIIAETVERGGRCVCVDYNKEIKNGKCEYTAEYIAKMESELDAKYASLSATIGGLEKSVWRDEDGNFNTARLVSDSVAGVVLGTVGGIVTSNLVKKAQVKQGFEDIGCYIGGQSVAGYGDEFTVGR